MTDPIDVVRAAGCVIYRASEPGAGGQASAPDFLVVHRPRYDDWSFAKGKVDPGETDLQTAVREVQEETGFVGEIGVPLATIDYDDHKGRAKSVRYWLMEQTGGEFVSNDEVDEIQWLPAAEARALLSYVHDQDLVDEVIARDLVPGLSQQPAPTPNPGE